jgi:TonB family protein
MRLTASAGTLRQKIVSLVIILFVTFSVVAQTDGESQPTETDAMQRRMARARSLAAVGKLAAAASELEAMRAATSDETVQTVARVLLMWIYVEMPDYARAANLLDEAFKARSPQNEASNSAYYALAGQTVNGVRTHLERYRTFGLNIADADLPVEAHTDLSNLRELLERVVEQAKAIRSEEAQRGAKNMDATALLEDAASVRLRLARLSDERTRWQGEVSEARQQLFSNETRIASISEVPVNRPAPSAAPANTATAAPATTAAAKSSDAKTTRQRSSNERNRESNAAAQRSETRPAAQPPAASNAQTPANTTDASAGRQGSGLISVGSLVGKAKQRISPTYPPLARTARITGIVIVYLIVNEKGEVETVTRADGPPQLQQAAMDAARRWKFNPTIIDGQPVRVSGFLSFNFSPTP